MVREISTDTDMQDIWNGIMSKGVRAARNPEREEIKLKIKAWGEEPARQWAEQSLEGRRQGEAEPLPWLQGGSPKIKAVEVTKFPTKWKLHQGRQRENELMRRE